MDIVIKARVCLKSEERIDLELLGDASEEMGPTDKYVTWRKMLYPMEEVNLVVQYDRAKSAIVNWDGGLTLVDERFSSLSKRVQELKQKFAKQLEEEIRNGAEHETEQEDEDEE